MTKRIAGLSTGYRLNADIDALHQEPADLNDYTDDLNPPVRTPGTTPPAESQGHEHPPTPSAPALRSRQRATRKRALRKQINLREEVDEQSRWLVDHFRRYARRTVNDADLYDALIQLIYDSRSCLEVGDLPERGRYGTATAQAFRTAIKRVFAEAIVAKFLQDTETSGGTELGPRGGGPAGRNGAFQS